MNKSLKKSYRFAMFLSVVCLSIIVVSVTYAYFTPRIVGEGSRFNILAGLVKLKISENKITAQGLAPIYDSTKDTKAQANTFTVSRTDDSNMDACYDLFLVVDEIGDNLKNAYFKYELDYGGNEPISGNFSNLTASADGTYRIALLNNQTLSNKVMVRTYTIRLWLSYDPNNDQTSLLTGDANSRTFKAHIVANGQSGACVGVNITKPTLYSVLTNGEKYSTVKTATDRGSFDEPIGGTEISDAYDTIGVIYKESTYKEDGLDVYYFAGNPQDNWVKFAGFYWRIIRTNEDRSVRLLYAGTSPDTTEGYITSKKNADSEKSTHTTYSLNGEYNNPRYVGYMYSETPEGEEQTLETDRRNTISSGVKEFVDNWYKENIEDKGYGSLVSKDAIYCNDRSGENYSNSYEMFYAPFNRLFGDGSPSIRPRYQCGQNSRGGYFNSDLEWVSNTNPYASSITGNADKFSVTTGSGGNGKLTYPVGLMTADEVAFAGGKLWYNSPNTYYYRNSKASSECSNEYDESCSVTGEEYWWTMSPFKFNGNDAIVFDVDGSDSPGYLNLVNVDYALRVARPVVSLSSGTLVSSGDGTAENPFVVE